MLNNGRIFSYFYYYIIPVAVLTLNINWLVATIKRFRYSNIIFVAFGIISCTLLSVIIPIAYGTHDFTYFTDGPIIGIYRNLLVFLFLLCVYEKHVSSTPNVYEYMRYYIYSQALYVIFTIIICLIPSFHQWIVTKVHMTEYQQQIVQYSYYYSRIGWEGFSGFQQSLECSIGAIFCLYILLHSLNDYKKTVIFNMLFIVMLIGNMCYARTGVIATIIAFVLYFVVLIVRRPGKTIIYPALLILFIIIGGWLAASNANVQEWLNWLFAQVTRYKTNGNFDTESIRSLRNMYNIKNPSSLIWGDGYYTFNGEYYKNVDVGWLRPAYFYGIIFSSFGFLAAIQSIKAFSFGLEYRIKFERSIFFLTLLILYFIFESKGETFFIVISIIVPFVLLELEKIEEVSL